MDHTPTVRLERVTARKVGHLRGPVDPGGNDDGVERLDALLRLLLMAVVDMVVGERHPVHMAHGR